MYRLHQFLPLLLLSLLSACASPSEPEAPKKAIPAPIRPLMQEPDSYHQHILDPPNILFDYLNTLYDLGPLNHAFVRQSRIAEAEITEYMRWENGNRDWTSDIYDERNFMKDRFIYDSLGLCTQHIYTYLESEGFERRQVTQWRYDAAHRPAFKDEYKLKCSLAGKCDTLGHFTSTFRYDAQGRLMEAIWGDLGGPPVRTQFYYDDVRGLVLELNYTVKIGYWNPIVYEAPGAIDAAERERIGEALLNTYLPEGRPKLKGTLTDEVRFFVTDGYSVLAIYDQQHHQHSQLWMQAYTDNQNKITHITSGEEARIFAYNSKGDLMTEILNQPSEPRILTTKYRYDKRGLVQEESFFMEYFEENPLSHTNKTVYQYKFRGEE